MKRSITSSVNKVSLALVIFALLTGCNLPLPSANSGGTPSVQIIQPQEGAQFDVGDTVSVVSTFSDSGGAKGMILEDNGVGIRDDKFFSPMYQGRMDQPWQPAQIGPAVLCVYLSTSNGQLLRSNCVTVTIGSANGPTSTPWETFTPTPVLTVTPILTTTPTLTPTAIVPIVTATQDANCRMGPSTGYGVTNSLLAGQTAPITGRNADSSWWVINIGGSECWIWGELVIVGGDTSQMPVITPPPLPTATFTQPAPLTAPTPISPNGTLDCASVTGGVTLVWSAVSNSNGINHYEWQLQGGVNTSGSSFTTQAIITQIYCGANYRWRVRAVDNLGNIGPWSDYMQFSIP